MNEENGTGVCLFRARHYLKQPFTRFQFLGMMPKLPGRDFLQRHVACAADLEQGIVSDGIKWLNAAVEQDWQASKITRVKLAVLFRHQNGDDLASEQRHEQPGQYLKKFLHAVLRLKLKPNRWVIN